MGSHPNAHVRDVGDVGDLRDVGDVGDDAKPTCLHR